MSYTSKRIDNIAILDTDVTEYNMLVEHNGSVKRVPGTAFNAFKTAIITSSDLDAYINNEEYTGDVTYSCINMTYDEAYEILKSGQGLDVYIKYLSYKNIQIEMFVSCISENAGNEDDCIVLIPISNHHFWEWYPDGTIVMSILK
jgi:hypothetical protein